MVGNNDFDGHKSYAAALAADLLSDGASTLLPGERSYRQSDFDLSDGRAWVRITIPATPTRLGA